MNEENKELSIRELFKLALAYAAIASTQLELEPNPLPYWLPHVGGPERTFLNKADLYIVHFLFPNVTDEERSALWNLRVSNEWIRSSKKDGKPNEKPIERYGRYSVAVSFFEKKLTAMQIDLLETNYFNPDATENHFNLE